MLGASGQYHVVLVAGGSLTFLQRETLSRAGSPVSSSQQRWRRDLYPSRCVERESEFMTWVNDPCSPHNWLEGTGGQRQADHPGSGAG